MKIIVGLGNPGEKYTGTRHNVGRDFVTWFAKQNSFPDFIKDSFLNASFSTQMINGEEYILVLPETYMNLSGTSVKNVFQKWSNLQPEDTVIVHDDIDVNFGEIKSSTDKGHGGHNGIKSIMEETGKNFKRIRIGICPKTLFGSFQKPHKDHVANFVLKKFGLLERGDLETIFAKAKERL